MNESQHFAQPYLAQKVEQVRLPSTLGLTLDAFVAFAKEWKELIGAVIGGIFSLLVALLVARQARRAEVATAATLLQGEFLRIHAMVVNAQMPQNLALTPEERAYVLAEHLCRFRVRLSPLFDASVARVLHTDVYLAGTMTLASSFIRDTEPVIERLSLDVQALHRKERLARSDAALDADVATVASGYKLIGEHAKHSARMLQTLVLGRWVVWRKLRRRICPSAPDRELFALLKRGAV